MEQNSVVTQVKAPMFTEAVCVREHRRDLFDYLVEQRWLWMLDDREQLDPIVGSAAAEACYMMHLKLLWTDKEKAKDALATPEDPEEIARCFDALRDVVKEQFARKGTP